MQGLGGPRIHLLVYDLDNIATCLADVLVSAGALDRYDDCVHTGCVGNFS